MQTINLKTTLSAYPKLSSSILKDYATREELLTQINDTKQYVDTNYVPEVADKTSNKAYARNGKERKWVELKESALLSDIIIYFGSNDLDELISPDQIQDLNFGMCSYKDTTYTITYDQKETGRLWICTTAPLDHISWGPFATWTGYTKQPANIEYNDKIFYCYKSDDLLTENVWEFRLTFDLSNI